MCSGGMNGYVAFCHPLEFIVLNRSEIIEQSLLHDCPGRLLERLRNVKKVIQSRDWPPFADLWWRRSYPLQVTNTTKASITP